MPIVYQNTHRTAHFVRIKQSLILGDRNPGSESCDCIMAKRGGKDWRATERYLSVVPDEGQGRDADLRNRYTREVRWEILLLKPVYDWFLALCKEDPCTADKVEGALDELATYGPQFGMPLAGRIHDSKIHNLKELRHRVSGTAEVCLLFLVEPAREAIVLVAGDQAGRWIAWYAEAIPLAEERYAAYQREARQEEE